MMLRRILISAGVLVVGGVCGAFAMFPHTNPSVIHAKVKILGSHLVYGPLSYDEAVWDVVLAGVRKGDDPWLQVAVDMRPSLDTHPGEEMLGAVSDVLEVNPIGAINLLLPVYGSEIVCATEAAGAPLTLERAKNRKNVLEGLNQESLRSSQYQECLRSIVSVLESHQTSGKRKN